MGHTSQFDQNCVRFSWKKLPHSPFNCATDSRTLIFLSVDHLLNVIVCERWSANMKHDMILEIRSNCYNIIHFSKSISTENGPFRWPGCVCVGGGGGRFTNSPVLMWWCFPEFQSQCGSSCLHALWLAKKLRFTSGMWHMFMANSMAEALTHILFHATTP